MFAISTCQRLLAAIDLIESIAVSNDLLWNSDDSCNEERQKKKNAVKKKELSVRKKKKRGKDKTLDRLCCFLNPKNLSALKCSKKGIEPLSLEA